MALLTALLGMNLWLMTLVIPLVLAAGQGAAWVRGCLPLAPLWLALSLWRRPRADAPPQPGPLTPMALLLLVPLLCLIPGAQVAQALGPLLPRPALALQALALLGYLGAACRHLTGDQPGPAVQTGALATPEVPRRWLRRIVIYRCLQAFSVVMPALLLYALCLHPPHLRLLRLSFGDHLAEAQGALIAAAALLWVACFHRFLLGPLRGHLDHDREVTTEILTLRQVARRGRPRPQFYLALILSLTSMILLVYRSLHP